jgi:hypothetical protein
MKVMLLNLPNGITGFRSSTDKELPVMDLVEFKQLCYSFIRQIGGIVKSYNNNISQQNFYTVEYDYLGESILILLNHHYPLLTFASSLDRLTFIEVPEISIKFMPYYTVLTKEYLNIPLTSNHLAALSKAELTQISYWNPKTVGEIIFNNWD